MSDSTNTFPTDRIVTGSLCYIFRKEDDGSQSVLLLKRARPPQQGMWSAPGGKMEQGESPDECVLREIREETGLTIANPQLRAISTVYDVEYPIHWLLFIYRAYDFTGAPILTEEGELRWIPLADLTQYPRPYADQQHWAHVLSDDPAVWRGKFVYDTPHTLISETRYP
jgi:8-oxo-dGTP diphosphatase